MEIALNQIRQILKEALTGEDVKKNVIAVYGGRFQPFHYGHYYAYKAMADKFGKENTYIVTSDSKISGKSPFDFKKKKAIISKMFGIDQSHVIWSHHEGENKSPKFTRTDGVLADWLQNIVTSKGYDEDDFALVYGVGKKDAQENIGLLPLTDDFLTQIKLQFA